MITITQDSEFMTNLLAANPVPAGKQFVAILDKDANPAVFALGEDSVLNLIINQDGNPSRVDFGALCKISGEVLAFGVQQNADSTLSIVIASNAGNNLSNVYILVGVMPADLLTIQPSIVLFAGVSYPLVYDVFLSNFTETAGTTNFPMTCLALAPPGALTKSSQLGYLDVSAKQGGGFDFSLNTSWRLATDPISILSVAFGTCPLGNGAFVLYTASDGNHLQFCRFGGSGFVSEMACPNGALSIDSYVNPATTYTELLVGGDAVTLFTYRQYCVGQGVGTPVVTSSNALGVENLLAAQSQGIITMWYTTATSSVYYYTAQLASITGGQLIPLLDEGQGAQISTLLAAKEAQGALMVDTLLSADGTGNLTMLQCASDTGIWQLVPFYAPSDANNMDVPSFTLRFKASSDDPTQPVQSCQLHIVSSGAVEVFANGASATIDTKGKWYQADAFGVVSVIVSTADMSSFTFQVDQFQAAGGTSVAIQADVLNPNGKLNTKLAFIQHANDLLNAKTQTGEPLIAPGAVSHQDAEQAASMINQLNKTQIFLGRPGQPLKRIDNSPKVYNPKGKRPTILACIVGDNTPREIERFLDRLSETSWYDPWGFFSWCYEKAKQATSWVLQKIGNVLNLVIEIAGTVYKFILDGVEAVGKAMSWVFEKITVGVQKLIAFVGFIFQWGDILDTSESIVAFINAGLGYAQDQVSGLKAKEQQFMQTLKDSVNNRQAPENVAAGTETKDPRETSDMDAAKNSVAYNWASYQVTYGGMAQNGKIDGAADLMSAMPTLEDGTTLQDLWNDLSTIFQTLYHYITAFGSDVSDLFTPTTTSTDAYNRLKLDLINAAVDTTQNVLDLLVDALSLVLTQFQALCNQAIEFPIFTALWKDIAGGRDFTVFNAFSLLMAIPVTVVYKVVKGTALPSLKGMDKTTFAAYVNGTLGNDDSDFGITRTQIQIVGFAIAVTAIHLEVDFQLISWVTNKIQGLAAETIDTGLIFVGVWGLDCTNVVALATARFVSWKTSTPRSETAPAVATWVVLTSIPSYMIKIIVNNDSESSDPSLLARHIAEDTFSMIKAWLAGVGEVVEDIKVKAIAKGLGYVCVTVQVVMKFVDFYIAAEDSLDRPLLLRE
ncbi:hypothetical protein MRS44_011686 [Fusarium solani]|uniref:uncharacterized protein n=1 Tax=Fusarium solani TaxID=169388 RepID=UPI0032C47400|nr:hypothetical protein MRS44_011686 [Fusarium solani]